MSSLVIAPKSHVSINPALEPRERGFHRRHAARASERISDAANGSSPGFTPRRYRFISELSPSGTIESASFLRRLDALRDRPPFAIAMLIAGRIERRLLHPARHHRGRFAAVRRGEQVHAARDPAERFADGLLEFFGDGHDAEQL
jgi:hypothetical protein